MVWWDLTQKLTRVMNAETVDGEAGGVEACTGRRIYSRCSRRSDSFAWWLLIRRSLEFDGHNAVNHIDGNLKYERMKK